MYGVGYEFGYWVRCEFGWFMGVFGLSVCLFDCLRIVFSLAFAFIPNPFHHHNPPHHLIIYHTQEVLSMEEVSKIWRTVAGDLDTKIPLSVFTLLNKALDAAIDEKVSQC